MADSEIDVPLMPWTPTCKRVVIEHTQGPLAGIYMILGTSDGLPKTKAQYPDYLPLKFPDPTTGTVRPGGASLITVKPRWIHYRETWGEANKGKLNEFHPDQV